jgi:hypothetical protein
MRAVGKQGGVDGGVDGDTFNLEGNGRRLEIVQIGIVVSLERLEDPLRHLRLRPRRVLLCMVTAQQTTRQTIERPVYLRWKRLRERHVNRHDLAGVLVGVVASSLRKELQLDSTAHAS